MIDVPDNDIIFRMDKSSDLVVEIPDIVVGPLNFRPAPVKWRWHGYVAQRCLRLKSFANKRGDIQQPQLRQKSLNRVGDSSV